MTTEPQSLSRPPKTKRARRLFTRALLTVVGVVAGLLLYVVCHGLAGYPKYRIDVLSLVGMILIALTGGIAWIIDECRVDRDG